MANRAAAFDPKVFSIADLERYGNENLPPHFRDYFNGGAMDMLTLRDNLAAFDRYRLQPRILRNVSKISTTASICGQHVDLPFGLGPSAMHCLAHEDGEIATSQAAAEMNVPMCLSSYSTKPLEDVAHQGSGNPYFMQICIVVDRSVTRKLLERAEAAGFKAVFVSVDVPVLGLRWNEMKNNFSLPVEFTFPNIVTAEQSQWKMGGGPAVFDASLEWREIVPWLRANTKLQVWLKGIISPEDVKSAIKHKVDGVIISNHGGRQLDGVPASLDALRQCAPLAKGHIKIGVDGGIRKGSDIFKAIALGADFCFLGRVAIWGLAYKGKEGVSLALKILQHELTNTMALTGCRSIADISINHLAVLETNGLLARL